MKAVKFGLSLLVLVVLVVIVIAPIGPLPGLFISELSANVPEQTPDTSDVDAIRLRVPAVQPRVVIIWVVARGRPACGWFAG